MTHDLALYPASGPGLGHLMRCYALAEAAVEMGKRVVVVLEEQAPDIEWPCAALIDDGTATKANVVVVDGRDDHRQVQKQWHIIDGLGDGIDYGQACGVIYPHFGAEAVEGLPAFVGPRWMPLRKVFRQRYGKAGQRWAIYGADHTDVIRYADLPPVVLEPGTYPYWADGLAGLICPPSTIAYEAMSQGVPVVLHDAHRYQHIAEAMLAKGVALTFDRLVGDARTAAAESAAEGLRHVDGLGASRLLQALL